MANRKQSIDITILGAGIGGLALAIGLSERGIAVTVYEAAHDFSPIGAGIGMGPNALQAMSLLNSKFGKLYEAAATQNERQEFEHSIFDALYADEGLEFGEKVGWHRGLVGAPYFTRSSAHRKHLLEIMNSLIPEGTVKFGKRASEIFHVGDKVKITFHDGETVFTDALIGCDGIKGMSRRAVLGTSAPEEIPAKYCNMYIYRGIIPMTNAKEVLGKHAGDAKWFMAKDKGLAIYPISKGKEENFVFFIRKTDPWTGPQEAIDCSKEEMVADLSSFDSRLVKLLDWAKPLKWPLFHHPSTPTYHNGHICMLGDVAHASSPGQAAGASQGLEDAVVLSHLLSLIERPEQVSHALRAYDAIRRPRAQKVVQTSEEAGEMYLWNLSGIGSDMQKIVDNANARLHWIWQHDIQKDVELAEEAFHNLMRQGEATDERAMHAQHVEPAPGLHGEVNV